MSGINGVDHLHVARIVILQHRHEQTGLDIRLDMKLSDPSQPKARQAQPTHCHAAVDRGVAGHGKAVDFSRAGITERPFVEAATEIEADAIVLGQILRLFRHAMFSI